MPFATMRLGLIILMLFGGSGCAPDKKIYEIDDLIAELQDEDEEVREIAAEELAQMGRAAKKAEPMLLTALRDDNEWVQMKAAEALVNIGPSPEVLDALGEAFKSDDEAVRDQIGVSLSRAGAAGVEVLAEILEDELGEEEAEVRLSAAKELGRIGLAGLEGLLGGLEDEDAWVRRTVTEGLGRLAEKNQAAIEGLILALEDEDQWVRVKAVDALTAIGPAAQPATAGLINALGDENIEVREKAVLALEHIGPDAMQQLIEAQKGEEEVVRLGAAKALNVIRKENPEYAQ